MGPLLFLIYINDMSELKLSGTLLLFADDAVLFYDASPIDELQGLIDDDLASNEEINY